MLKRVVCVCVCVCVHACVCAQIDLQRLFAHMSAAARAIDATSLDMQNIANIMNAQAKTYRYDAPLLNHLAEGLRANALDEGKDLSRDTQAMANVMHALAILNHRDRLEDLMPLLIPHITRLDFDDSRASEQVCV